MLLKEVAYEYTVTDVASVCIVVSAVSETTCPVEFPFEVQLNITEVQFDITGKLIMLNFV